MMYRLFGLVLVLGCAAGRRSAPEPELAATGSDSACVWQGIVTVHVQNTGSADVEISFGSYTPVRAAPGLSRTTYDVSRSHLQGSILLRIARGGLQTGGPARVATEPVICNDATLIIGADLRSSFFYGGRIVVRAPRH
jgi:hypothetical protein